MIYTVSDEQAEALAARWNELAKPHAQIEADNAHHLLGDNADYDFDTDGCHQVELSGQESLTGNPSTFYIEISEVTSYADDTDDDEAS